MRRLQSVLRWTVLTGALAILLIWVASAWVWIDYEGPSDQLTVAGGVLRYKTFPSSGRGWSIRHNRFYRFRWWSESRSYETRIPLWIPLLPLAGLGAWLWRSEKRSLMGHCSKCSYDLTGNTSGVCPECGTPFGPE